MKDRFYRKSGFLFAVFLLAFLSVAVFYALRVYWVFYTPNMWFIGGAMGLFFILLANAALALTLYGLRRYGSRREYEIPFYQKKWFSVLCVISAVLALLAAAAVVCILVFGGAESDRVVLLYLKRMAPWIAVVIGAAVAVVMLPACKGRKKAVIAVLLCVAVILGSVSLAFPLTPYKITSDPLVLDTGSDYSVVFATSAKGTGFVEYEYNGAAHKTYAQESGRIIGDRLIHSVRVPYRHLQNNTYTVGSTRVIEAYSYGSRLGKTVISKAYTFTAPKGSEAEYLVLSDWHSYVDRAYAAVSKLGHYDAVVLLGDAAAGMDFEEQAAENIVKFGGNLTHGAMPAVFVRGNHDTRGGFADKLPSYLGLDSLYYTVEMGDLTFIVLDSGEDKEDGHIEYGGLNAFTPHRQEMVEWLQSSEMKGKHKIALSHAWQICEPEPELSRAAWQALDDAGVRLLLSGHKHVCRFLSEEKEDEQAFLSEFPQIAGYIDGGISGKNYVASKIKVSASGVGFLAKDTAGNTVLEMDLSWAGR